MDFLININLQSQTICAEIFIFFFFYDIHFKGDASGVQVGNIEQVIV